MTTLRCSSVGHNGVYPCLPVHSFGDGVFVVFKSLYVINVRQTTDL